MAEELKSRRGETAAHAGLKRLALLWAQSRGYSVCAFEVQLPRCRFRADLAGYRPNGKEIGTTAIFECKQAFPDLRRDNGCSAVTTKRLEKVFQRRQALEKNLRIQDRKSTRLNSSHVSISYAVFCLKKKIQIYDK